MVMFFYPFVLLPALVVEVRQRALQWLRPDHYSVSLFQQQPQPKGGPCFDLKSVGCSFKRARWRGGHTAREGMRSFFKAWMNQLFCEHTQNQFIPHLSSK